MRRPKHQIRIQLDWLRGWLRDARTPVSVDMEKFVWRKGKPILTKVVYQEGRASKAETERMLSDIDRGIKNIENSGSDKSLLELHDLVMKCFSRGSLFPSQTIGLNNMLAYLRDRIKESGTVSQFKNSLSEIDFKTLYVSPENARFFLEQAASASRDNFHFSRKPGADSRVQVYGVSGNARIVKTSQGFELVPDRKSASLTSRYGFVSNLSGFFFQ